MNKKLIILAAILFYLSVYLFSQNAHASDQGDWWLQRNVTIGDGLNEHRRINVTSRTAYDAPITKDGITKMERLFKNVVVEDVPSKQKLGKTLLSRAKAYKGGLAGVLGGAAITGMIEAVGWVMEDGTYVKYKNPEPNTDCGIDGENCTELLNIWYSTNRTDLGTYSSAEQAANAYFNKNTSPPPQEVKDLKCTLTTITSATCSASIKNAYGYWVGTLSTDVKQKTNPKYSGEKEKERIMITDEDVGGIASGDYKDPVNPVYDITDKKYKTPVIDAYQHDPNGIGDELANEIDDRIKNAPPTSDGKPAPVGDSRYSTAPQSDTTTNDRSWTEETDTTGEGTTTPVTDPETGEATGQQSISFKFPEFCQWAFKVCDWYDEWKKTDQWMKEEPQLEDKQLEVEQINPINYQRQNYVQFGKSCPFSPQQYALPLGIGAIEFEADASVICTYGAIANPYIVALGHLGSLLYLLYALRSGSA